MKRQYQMEPHCDSDIAGEFDYHDDEQIGVLRIPPKKRTKLTQENQSTFAV